MAVVLYKWFFACLSLGIMHYSSTTGDKKLLNHPFYISVTEISHNAADKNLEISCKIFTDDFETSLSKSSGTKVDLFNPKNKQAADKQISAYIKRHLNLKLDNKPVVLDFVGFERENEAVWSYFQVPNISAPKKIDIINDLLFESFNQQINLVHVSVGSSRKSTKLNYPDSIISFQF